MVDKLWLEDCLVDLNRDGWMERDREVMLHEIDKVIEMQILTPCGEEVIRINKVVKQGTIFGPILCCSNTANIIL